MLWLWFLAGLMLGSVMDSCCGLREGVTSPPIIDIQSLWTELDSNVVKQLEHAFIEHGLALIKGVSISSDEREAYFHAVQELMDLEEQDKLSVRLNSSKAIGRGYLPPGSESGLAEFVEPKEGYSYGYPNEHTEDNKLTSPNIWPAGLSRQSVRVLSDLFMKFSRISNLIIQSIAAYRNALNIPNKMISIDSAKGAEISLLRVFHYFHTQSTEYLSQLHAVNPSGDHAATSTNAIGSSPHTDWGLLTLIMPNHVTGLQYVHDGAFVDVPYVPGTLVVNAGDFLSLATKGEYHSPVHRVLSPVSQNRMSFVYFYYPDYDTLLTLPTQQQQEDCAGVADTGADTDADAAGKVCEPYQEQYNTLLSKHMLRGRGGEGVRFGDYILEKWQGVSRTGY